MSAENDMQYGYFKARAMRSAEDLARDQCRSEVMAVNKIKARSKALKASEEARAKQSQAKVAASAKKSKGSGQLSNVPASSNKTSEDPFDPYNPSNNAAGGAQGGLDNFQETDFTSTTMQHRVNVMAKILRHLKERHLRRDNTPLSIDEILDETRQLHILNSTKRWLASEALPSNPKIQVVDNGLKFLFKPPFKLKDGKSLMRLLKQYDLKGLGGIMGEDLQESLPNCDRYLAKHADDIICIERPTDKKKVYFFKDKSADLGIDEEFKRLWRTVNMDSLEGCIIDDDFERPPPKAAAKAKGPRKKRLPAKRDNSHLSHVLEEYD